jgi:hypothetical protein
LLQRTDDQNERKLDNFKSQPEIFHCQKRVIEAGSRFFFIPKKIKMRLVLIRYSPADVVGLHVK